MNQNSGGRDCTCIVNDLILFYSCLLFVVHVDAGTRVLFAFFTYIRT